MEKRTAQEKEKYQPSYDTTILSEVSALLFVIDFLDLPIMRLLESVFGFGSLICTFYIINKHQNVGMSLFFLFFLTNYFLGDNYSHLVLLTGTSVIRQSDFL